MRSPRNRITPFVQASSVMNTPVVLLIYNRPDLTARVFAKIARARPARLLVVADGPKDAADAVKCQLARAVTDKIEWDCCVDRDYAAENLGCKRRVSSGLDWAFSIVEEAIILEDDCLPDITFFPFCEELLCRYRKDERIGHISGDNFCKDSDRTPYSYSFSRYTNNWGWATWRRSWQQYDVDMKLWPEIKATRLYFNMFSTRAEALCFEGFWDDVYAEKIDMIEF